MKTSRYTLLAAVLLGAGASTLLFFALGPPRGADPVSESSRDSRIEREREQAPEDFPIELGESGASRSGPQRWVLDLDSPGGRDGSGSRQDVPKGPEGRRAGTGLSAGADHPGMHVPELRKGRGEVQFEIEDASGQRLRDVTVFLQQMDAGGGAEEVVTGRAGEARFKALAPAPYSYRAQAPDGSEASASFRLDEGERKVVTVRMGASDLSITGRVRSSQGDPVSGIELSAVRHRFASSVTEDESGDGRVRKTVSGADGTFEIKGLSEGEYEVQTTATRRYASVKVTLQAGAGAADLVLVEGFAVQGRVTNEDGKPLARVWVGPSGQRDRFVYTDDTGRYRLQLDLSAEHLTAAVRFQLAGFEEQELALPVTGTGGAGGLGLDAVLRPLEDATTVSGIVRTERGDPIDRATVVFGSPELNTHYQAVSDAEGHFTISNVEAGPGYQLRVLPSGAFRDYSQQRIWVPEDGMSFEVVLEALPTGRLSGHMVDAEGSPVPNFRLWLLSRDAVRSAVPVTGDGRGYFELSEVPSGALTFDTRSSPRLLVSGLFLPDGGEREVTLVLDWGGHVMTGEILDDRGDPAGGAEVFLSWSFTAKETTSTSRRVTQTDPEGTFRFAQLGPGEHLLEVRLAGYYTVQERHEVGRRAAEVEVRLERNSP